MKSTRFAAGKKKDYVARPDFVRHPTARYSQGGEGGCYTSYTHGGSIVIIKTGQSEVRFCRECLEHIMAQVRA